MEQWLATAVGKMHINGISNKELAVKLGYSQQYTSEILNGRKKPKGVRERVLSAIDEIISDRT